MKGFVESRRNFLRTAGMTMGSSLLLQYVALCQSDAQHQSDALEEHDSTKADYTLHIRTTPIEIAPDRIISLTSYNGEFPGPLLRLTEGRQVTVDVYNDTDVPEQLHWHGQEVPVDVDGASEEGTPYIPAHGKRRIAFVPKPAGFRFYHTHNLGVILMIVVLHMLAN